MQSHQLFQTLTLEGFDISPTQDKTKFERDEARSGFTSSTGEALICSMPHPTVRWHESERNLQNLLIIKNKKEPVVVILLLQITNMRIKLTNISEILFFPFQINIQKIIACGLLNTFMIE